MCGIIVEIRKTDLYVGIGGIKSYSPVPMTVSFSIYGEQLVTEWWRSPGLLPYEWCVLCVKYSSLVLYLLVIYSTIHFPSFFYVCACVFALVQPIRILFCNLYGTEINRLRKKISFQNIMEKVNFTFLHLTWFGISAIH